MQSIYVFGILCTCIVTISTGENADFDMEYLKKYSNLNVEEILSNERLFSAYYKCFMDKGSCSPEAKDMKSFIPALVKSVCSKCTLEQKKEVKKHMNFMIKNRPAEWKSVSEKYDPNGESLNKFLSSVPDR